MPDLSEIFIKIFLIYNMKYLENPICEFKFLKNYSDKKKPILSTCLFRMKNHYKNFKIYILGLKRWIKFLKSFDNDYVMRIFIDKNIYEDQQIIRIINRCEKIEPVIFTCPEYMNRGYHVDVFGSLVRFFPIFKFRNNDAGKVIIVDIDLSEEDMGKVHYLMKSLNKGIIGSSMYIENMHNRTYIPYMFAGTLQVDDKYPKELLIDFISNINNINYNKEKKSKITVYSPKSQNNLKKPFRYGVDEFFLNNYLLKNEKSYSLLSLYYPSTFLYYYKDHILSNNYSHNILKYIIGKYYKNGITNNIMFDIIDKSLYRINNINIKTKYIARRFYIKIRDLLEKKDYWLRREIMEFINIYLYNVLKCYLVITVKNNNNTIDIKDIKIGDPINL